MRITITMDRDFRTAEEAYDWVAENVSLSGDYEVTVHEEEDLNDPDHLELASLIADEIVREHFHGAGKLDIVEDENGDERYTEEAQDMFNDLLDKRQARLKKFP
jgi:hypothetical protein